MALSKKEIKIAALLLKEASEEYSNHGCNELSDEFISEADLTDEEKINFVREFHKWNGDLNWQLSEFGEITPNRFDSLPDSALMHFLADKLEKEG